MDSSGSKITTKKPPIKVLLVVLLVAVALGVTIYANCEQAWKITGDYIPVSNLNTLLAENNRFIGWNISDLIPLMSKGDKYYVFSRNTDDYSEIIKKYPELSITGERAKLYCFAFTNGSAEELAQVGFFVNESDTVIEVKFDICLLW